jgi:hypothetical protein
LLNERERIEIDEFKQRYESLFEAREHTPHEYEICPEDYCDYMMHVLAKTYGIPPAEAGKYFEADYIRLVMFNNLEVLKNESIIKSNSGEK